MTEEEKKAIERFRSNANYCVTSKETTKTILNLIQKQQEEIEKKDKIIDLIAEELNNQYRNHEPCDLDGEINCKKYKNCKECIKQYFEKKVEGKK